MLKCFTIGGFGFWYAIDLVLLYERERRGWTDFVEAMAKMKMKSVMTFLVTFGERAGINFGVLTLLSGGPTRGIQ
jgi:hypothetical protein